MVNPPQENTFHKWWVKEYPASPPIGFRLRQEYGDEWSRIHSLPNGKRWPENDDEMLKSANAAANDGTILFLKNPSIQIRLTPGVSIFNSRRFAAKVFFIGLN